MKQIFLESFSDILGVGVFSDKTRGVQYDMGNQTKFGQKSSNNI